MTKKRQIKFTLIRTLVAISIALLVAALLIFISAGGSTFAEKLNATKEALKQMLIGPLFRMSEKKGTSFEAKRFTEILAAMIPTTFTSSTWARRAASCSGHLSRRWLPSTCRCLPECIRWWPC